MTQPRKSILLPLLGTIGFSGMVLSLLEIVAPRQVEHAHQPWVSLLGFFVTLFGYTLLLGVWTRS